MANMGDIDAAKEKQEKIDKKTKITCTACNGSGKVFVPYSPADTYEECRICKGEGKHTR